MSAILATTDLSPAAAAALPFALRLARGLGLPVELLHVVHAPVLTPAFTHAPERDRDEAAARLRAEIDALPAEVAVTAVTRIAEDVVDAILARAREADARFVVAATSGRSGWQRQRLGSTSVALLRAADRPVVCVPSWDAEGAAPPPGLTGRRVLVTSDLSEVSRRALAPGAELARALGLPLTLLAVASGPDSEVEAWGRALRGWAADLAASGLEAEAEVHRADDVVAALLARAAALDAAVLCMASHGRGGLRRALLGSVVEAVLPAVRVPVAVVPAAAAGASDR